MKIEIAATALDYLRAHGSALHIATTHQGCAHCGKAPVPYIGPGVPKNPRVYRKVTVDGVEVYYHSEFEGCEVRVSLDRWLWMENLSIEIDNWS